MPRRLALVALAVLALTPSAAHAAVFKPYGGLASAGNGLALGPDGNFWVAQESAGSVARMSPSGQVLGTIPVGAGPTGITVSGNNVWVAVTGALKLTWIDATSASPTAHDISTASFSTCGPVGIAAGGNGRIYFSLPIRPSECSASQSRVGYMGENGAGIFVDTTKGQAFDLEVTGGKLFVPDFGADVVRRLNLNDTLTTESTVSTPAGGGPTGIARDGAGRMWVTLSTSGRLARFNQAQLGGAASELIPTGGTLDVAFGIVLGPDGMYATGSESARVARVAGASDAFTFFPIAGAKPWDIVNGPSGDLWMTDRANARLLRLVDRAPGATTGDAGAITETGASLAATVASGGNDTRVVFDYGPTESYGQTTAEMALAAAADPEPVQAAIGGLAPNTTYHYRARATNALGEVPGGDRTFTTLPDRTPPIFVSASLTAPTFAVDPKGTAETIVKSAKKPKKGTTFVYNLSEAARVLFRIEQKATGRKVGGKCRPASKSNRTKPKCTRLVNKGLFAQASPAGVTRRKFSGKLGKKPLPAGSYQATLTATDPAGNVSKPKRLSFKIVRP